MALPLNEKASVPNVLDNLIPVGGSSLLRIVGGTVADLSQWPWQVSLQLYRGAWYHICGGSLIAEQWVITAAHCLDGIGSETLRVSLGGHKLNVVESTEQRIGIDSYTIHDEYNAEDRGIPNDVGLIRLREPAQINAYVQPVQYAKANETFFSSDVCFISGWGLTSANGSLSNVLKTSHVTIIPQRTCSMYWRNMIHDFHICVIGNNDSSACIGDSGGPLVCQHPSGHVLCGVTSWGSSACDLHFPNIYMRISSFRDWIDSNIGNN